jgi:5-methylcytosine-specific restriction endonuclease McrA
MSITDVLTQLVPRSLLSHLTHTFNSIFPSANQRDPATIVPNRNPAGKKRRRKRKRPGSDSVRARKWRAVAWVEQDGICYWCPKFVHFDDATADHLKRWADGGKANRKNIVMACRDCNSTRHHKGIQNGRPKSGEGSGRNTSLYRQGGIACCPEGTWSVRVRDCAALDCN